MNDLYETLRKRGLTTSQRDFSTRYAGKSPSYLATMNTPSVEVAICVFRKLVTERRWLLALRVARMVLFGPNRQARA